MANATLANIRDRLELILSIPSSDGYVDSQSQLDDINMAYEKTAYAHDWSQLLRRDAVAITANVDRYPLPTRFRKFHHVKVLGREFKETELAALKKSRYRYAVDRDASQIILSTPPADASTAYTLQNSESAGAATTIELDTVSGLSQLDEVWIDSAAGTDEFTLVSSISGTSIVARLRAAKSASDVLYRLKEIIEFWYYQRITLLSGASDVTILPDELDYVIPHYAAFIAYSRLEDFNAANNHLKIWEDGVRRAFLAQDKNSTGEVTQFSI